jgi:hypothetical protein
MASRGTLVITQNSLLPNLEDIDDRAVRAIRLILDYWTARAVSQMRANARWTDRTTNARNGLSAIRNNESDGGSLVLFHVVPYGIWLEVRWSGRYAIIGPTMNDIAPQVHRLAGEGVISTMRL